MKKIDWGILEKLAILVVIISGIIASIYYLWGGLKMVWSMFTIPINSFWLIIAIWFFIAVLMGVNRWNRKKKEEELRTLNSKHEKEIQELKPDSEVRTKQLEEKEKQYNELYEKTKPPYSVDKLIKAEPEYNPIGRVWIEGKLPHLIFYIRVINRTNYYFTPKKVFLACYHGKDLVFKEEWEERAKTPHIIPSELQRLADGSIQFHVPKEKIGDSKRKLTLSGHIEYITEEGIIHDILRKSVKLNITKLEYTLDGNTAQEPKGRVLIAK